MIEKIKTLPEFLDVSGVSVRIESLFNTYGQTILDLYVQKKDGVVTALMAVLGSGCTLVAHDDADFDELRSFLRCLGVEAFCDFDTAERLGHSSRQTAELLLWQGDMPQSADERSVKIANVYDLLKNGEDGDIVLPCFDEWYADFCVRVNHKGAEYFALDNAVAVAGFTTDREALITGVAVEKSQRKKGLGAAAVKGLIGKLKVKNPDIKVFVCAVEDRVKFYEKIGFEVLGQVAVLEF